MQPLELESDRIERHIEQTRETLGRHLNELETRVRTTLDWRSRYQKNPWAFLGLAFGAAAALAASRRAVPNTSPATPSKRTQTWSRLQDALLATASKQAETFLTQAVSDFAGQYRKTVSPPRPF
jgi:hypothetical protein